MSMPQRRLTHPARKLLYAMLALPVVVCWALYGYYFLAQHLKNPMPVTGQFVSAACVGSGASSGRLGGGSFVYLETVYEFVSRSSQRAASGVVKDRITERMLFDQRWSDCEAALQTAMDLRAPTTLWAGEDAMDARFRARLTAEQAYPSALLLVVPLCLPALFFGVRRWGSRAQRKPRATEPNLNHLFTAVGALVVCLMGFFYYLMMIDGRASLVLILFLTPFFTLGFVLLYVGVRGLIRAARGVP